MTSSLGQTIPLQPITEYWTYVTDTCNNVKAVDNDTTIMFQLPAWPGHCHADLVTSKYSVQLSNPGLTVKLAGWHSCNAGSVANGVVEFRVHGIDSNGNDYILATYTIANLTQNPSVFNVGDISNYVEVYFEIYAYGLYYSGFPGLFCAFYMEPFEATITGQVPPATGTVNVEVTVEDSSTGLPIQGATVELTASAYSYSQKETTNSNGIATFTNVPFNTVAPYEIIASAKGYKTSSLNLSGQNLENDNYAETISLEALPPSKLNYMDYLYIAGGIAGVGIAAYLISKFIGFEIVKEKAKSTYRKVKEKL